MKKIIPLLVLIFFIVTATAATAGDRPRSEAEKRDRWSGLLSSLESLDLTEEQSKKITDIYKDYREKTDEIRHELLKQKTELDLLWMEAEVDADKIRAAQKKVNETRGKIQDETTEFKLAMLSVMTPDHPAAAWATRVRASQAHAQKMRRPRPSNKVSGAKHVPPGQFMRWCSSGWNVPFS